MKNILDIIILTNNEELNLPRALKSVVPLGAKVWAVDSGSTDNTEKITEAHGGEFVRHLEYENQARQFNWALDHLPLKGEWILRLDADEWLTSELADEIKEALRNTKQYESTKGDATKYPDFIEDSRQSRSETVRKYEEGGEEINGFYIKRRVYFMGRWIRHGGYYPTWILRLFRRGKGRSEDRQMDEHIVVSEGRVERMRHDFVDENRKGLAAWTEKHNDFSTREARARVIANNANKANNANEGVIANNANIGGQAGRKRWIKQNLYGRLPLFCRAFLYFIYRYIFRLGFLDGKEGLIFHFLQGFWHQFLIDAKMYEQQRANGGWQIEKNSK